MSHSTPRRRQGRHSFTHRVAAPAGCLLLVLLAAGCTRTVTAAGAPAAPASAAPTATAAAAPGSSAPVSNAGLQVLGSTAAANGRTGTGGTVIGAAIQPAQPVWVQLSAQPSVQLGTHLVDINGSTLYRFGQDTAQPSVSTCSGACATKWPPVTVEQGGTVYLAGVDPAQVGSIRRADGQTQLTVGGWPIYRFSGDTQPGDAKGQGIDGTWFAIAADGDQARP